MNRNLKGVFFVEVIAVYSKSAIVTRAVSALYSPRFMQGWGTCGRREHFNMDRIRIFVAQNKIQYRVKTKLRDKQMLDSESREASLALPHSFFSHYFP